ncbi:putative C-type lectin domain family 20 member A, partial [Labrus bergylta]|uniref:putative C-type lectin domain family 20 member A n=1 Tax=Labrus bergylta TaxID=56723 RepID=UPI0033142CEB
MHRQFHYINLKMTWADAQHYCRDKYTDLATIESVSDISRLNRPGISKAWIGLHDDPEAWKMTMGNETISWRWSTTGVTSKTGYYSWQINQPDNGPRAESCVQATADGKWDAVNCYRRWYFVCYTATSPGSQKTYVMIRRAENWKNAQTYCRRHHTDLAMIENAEENSNVMSLHAGTVWIGLYPEAWRWSDNSDISFRNWKEEQPYNYNEKNCVMSNEQYQWEDLNCKAELPFWCQ